MDTSATKPKIIFYTKDVEEVIGKSRITLRRWWTAKKFPSPQMLNGRLAWRAEVIYRWINENLGEHHE
jgi:predicted DNA-binding transcriptional regulator AlpA